MALMASVLSLPDIGTTSTNSTTLASASSTAAITIVGGELIAINADQDVTIRFSGAASVTAATATDFRMPAEQTYTFSVSKDITKMFFYNLGTTTTTYWWQYLSRF